MSSPPTIPLLHPLFIIFFFLLLTWPYVLNASDMQRLGATVWLGWSTNDFPPLYFSFKASEVIEFQLSPRRTSAGDSGRRIHVLSECLQNSACPPSLSLPCCLRSDVDSSPAKLGLRLPLGGKSLDVRKVHIRLPHSVNIRGQIIGEYRPSRLEIELWLWSYYKDDSRLHWPPWFLRYMFVISCEPEREAEKVLWIRGLSTITHTHTTL
jgi:hypothetical protein